MKFKLKKGMSLGALAAEKDELLENVFVDLGHLEKLKNTSDPVFLIIGRTGSGKTALIKKLTGSVDNVSQLDPDELSMQYLQNSQILKTISSWGVNLEIFYKYLWKHVCILELIRLRYGNEGDVPSKLKQMFDFTQIWKKEEKRAQEISQEYLQKYSSDYWIKADTRIKSITNEIESKLTSDPTLSGKLGLAGSSIAATIGASKMERAVDHVESEIVDRAQNIVSDFQIAALNRVIDSLEKYGFDDPQKHYYLVIDDLDKNWMPDDTLYLELLKSLLYTVNELNGKLRSVKIIVALRENIYHRVFQKASKHEPQREKWIDVSLKLTWTKEDLIQLINARLFEMFRGEYTTKSPKLEDILPPRKKRSAEEAMDFMFDRTFMRPRDVIDFLNTCISNLESLTSMTWSVLTRQRKSFHNDDWTQSLMNGKTAILDCPCYFL
ncbi:MAG TPA: hypothetical protein VFA71_13840 [Terriglobales bacterium]|nr:hypothetical protein [Terriglobales bacterium]